MTNKDIIRDIEKSGMKISKEKLIEAIRRSPDKEFGFAKDSSSPYAVIKAPVN